MVETTKRDRRAERREATKAEIVDAAWELARSEGLAGISLREIAKAIGMQAPSLYGYFGSKHEIYDAMFAAGVQQFVDGEPWEQLNGEVLHDVRCIVRYYVEFCAADLARYQLLFQRPIPGFEPARRRSRSPSVTSPGWPSTSSTSGSPIRARSTSSPRSVRAWRASRPPTTREGTVGSDSSTTRSRCTCST